LRREGAGDRAFFFRGLYAGWWKTVERGHAEPAVWSTAKIARTPGPPGARRAERVSVPCYL
jgi:hypothetical protein